jgi:hypothetical protein
MASNMHSAYNGGVVAREKLKDLVHRRGLRRKEQVLICLAVEPDKSKALSEIRDLAAVAGLKGARDWNLSAILASLPGKAVRTSAGWELTADGKADVGRLVGVRSPAHVSALASLRAHISRLKSADVRPFLEEAIGCAEEEFHRAAVVLSWIGALGVLYDNVVAKHLGEFNVEARRRDAKWRNAKTLDDLARMKEFDFLQVLEAISVVGKSVKGELEACLKLRNACGHPNSLQVSESKVAAHIETLVLNVFAVFA